jgi:tetratricopeptide (TPR) repeat protein
MVDLHRASSFSPALILLIIFSSCALMKSVLSPKAPVQELSQARQYVTKGEYQKAIDFYNAEYKRHPQDRELVKEYVKSLEEIKTAANRALGREDFANAGKTYYVLLKNYPDFKDFADLLSFDRAQLNSRLTNCKTVLYNKGFQEYREGNLRESIALWQDYLAIDPDNTDIKKALNTAKTQQKNLRQTK